MFVKLPSLPDLCRLPPSQCATFMQRSGAAQQRAPGGTHCGPNRNQGCASGPRGCQATPSLTLQRNGSWDSQQRWLTACHNLLPLGPCQHRPATTARRGHAGLEHGQAACISLCRRQATSSSPSALPLNALLLCFRSAAGAPRGCQVRARGGEPALPGVVRAAGGPAELRGAHVSGSGVGCWAAPQVTCMSDAARGSAPAMH